MRREPASFRDPSGHIFYNGNKVFRHVSKKYKDNYDLFMSSGFYEKLVEKDSLIPHKEVSPLDPKSTAYKTIEVKKINFISYPYEWSFSQLKDAALLTLEIQQLAIEHGMSLKDASAYNVQFVEGKPLFIDSLSFEKYEIGKPWVAYKQFCQHFLGPLILMSKVDVRLQQLLKHYIDGLPLDLVSRLLPKKSYLKPSLLTHIHIHAKSQNKYANTAKVKSRPVSKFALLGIVHSLESAVKSLKWNPKGTEWGEYYTFTNYSDSSFKYKRKVIEEFIAKSKPKTVWDLGANDGLFSRIASTQDIQTVAFDIDPIAVEKNYKQVKEHKETTMLPILSDLTNPSPSIGWFHRERQSLVNRSQADMVFALALIHHMAISNNVPLEMLAEFFASLGKSLVIEFVPKADSKVKILLATRPDIFDQYNEQDFEKIFSKNFKIEDKKKISGTKRTLYLMKRR